FLRLDPRFSLVNQANSGLSASRNVGIELSKGKYLNFLDSDDWVESSFLIRVIKLIDEFPEFALIRTGYGYWDKPNGFCFHRHIPAQENEVYPKILYQNLGPCHSLVIKKELVNRIGNFDPSLKSCEDWDFWIRAGKMGAKIYSISKVLVGYRYVPDSMSRNPLVMYEALSEVSRRAGQPDKRLPKEAPFNQVVELDYPSIQKKHLIRMVGVLLHQGKVNQAAEWYLKEKESWSWEETDRDWKGLATYLSWGYFFEPHQIDTLLSKTSGDLAAFFKVLGYSKPKIQLLLRLIFEPQLKRRNHQEYGKLIGGIKNKLGWY
ncbi:MAG: glycosyltransferase, partial [Algoriphagus sp.]|nr:glycosyltransferase [Algoriphagus sp.]